MDVAAVGAVESWGTARSLTMMVLKSFMIGSVVIYAALLVYMAVAGAALAG